MTKHGEYDVNHPLVRCTDCSEDFTFCDLGNHYCPSCGESGEGAPIAPCEGCPCTDGGDVETPCCWCGRPTDEHTERVA